MKVRIGWATRAAAFVMASSACGGGGGNGNIDAPRAIDGAHADSALDAFAFDAPPDANPLEPPTLGGTGLCVDEACSAIASGPIEYAPQYVLFADGATKRRWILLPPGAQIDTSDPDHWNFPVGTKLWKEFTINGTRVETRYLVKEQDTPTGWFTMAYAWNDAQTEADAAPFGVGSAMGFDHNIPSSTDCKSCHYKLLPSIALGFGAMSLDFHQTQSGLLDLDGAVAAGMLTDNPPGAASPHYPLPTDGGSDALAAIGYLHANCGHCHNSTSDIFQNNTPIQLRLEIGSGSAGSNHLASIDDTLVYETTVDVTSTSPVVPTGSDCTDPGSNGQCAALTTIVKSGDPADSILFFRFNAQNPSQHMPKLGTSEIDPDGDALLQTWITNL